MSQKHLIQNSPKTRFLTGLVTSSQGQELTNHTVENYFPSYRHQLICQNFFNLQTSGFASETAHSARYLDLQYMPVTSLVSKANQT